MTIDHEDLNLDALEATARAAIMNDDPEDWPLEGAVGWDRPEDNKFVAALTPGTVLALIARLREAEARVEPIERGWRATARAEADAHRRLREAEACIERARRILEENLGLDNALLAARILSRYKPTTENGEGMNQTTVHENGCHPGCRHECGECRLGLGVHRTCDPRCEVAEHEIRAREEQS